MNSVQLIGRWTKDLELRYTQTGMAVTRGTLAVDRPFAKDDSQKADFIPIVIWGKTAEAVTQHTGKGQQVAIEGRIQVRKFADQDGNNRWATEVVANRVQFLGKPSNNNDSQPDTYTGDVGGDDELPF